MCSPTFIACGREHACADNRYTDPRRGNSEVQDHVAADARLRYGRDHKRGCRSRELDGMRNTWVMAEPTSFSAEQARAIGGRIGIDWETSRFDVEQFRMGLEVELEHGRRDPATNVSDDDELTTGKIAWAHLNEFPDYYTRLARMEAEAERFWSEHDRGRTD